ncbi:MAG: hypothetical protein IJH20_00105 [Bacilli bacterium]|nr:hypothetical protein [Bacilli bacterium]
MTVYDIKNEEVLKSQGYRPYKDSTLKSMPKDDLIDLIRILEHNWAGEIKANWLQSYRLQWLFNAFNETIKEIETYEPKYYDKDLAEWFNLDVNYLKENTCKCLELDREDKEKELYGDMLY